MDKSFIHARLGMNRTPDAKAWQYTTKRQLLAAWVFVGLCPGRQIVCVGPWLKGLWPWMYFICPYFHQAILSQNTSIFLGTFPINRLLMNVFGLFEVGYVLIHLNPTTKVIDSNYWFLVHDLSKLWNYKECEGGRSCYQKSGVRRRHWHSKADSAFQGLFIQFPVPGSTVFPCKPSLQYPFTSLCAHCLQLFRCIEHVP